MLKSYFQCELEPWFEDGLALAKNEKWRRKRKFLNTTFHTRILQNFLGTINEASLSFVKDLDFRLDSVDHKSTFSTHFFFTELVKKHHFFHYFFSFLLTFVKDLDFMLDSTNFFIRKYKTWYFLSYQTFFPQLLKK